MPRSTGRWESDSGFADGVFWFGVMDWGFTATTAPVLTRNAAGNYSWACAANQTINCFCPINGVTQRTGYKISDQEQFGGAYGPGPASGNPPFTGATQLTPLAAFIPKGIQVADITLVYSIGTAALTSQTMTLKSALFANTSAVSVSAVTLSTATALATASTTNPYVTKIAVSAPAYTVADLTALSIDNVVVAPTSSIYNLYGAFVHCTFNYQ